MATQDIVVAAPWRVSRGHFEPYELAIVQQALTDGMSSVLRPSSNAVMTETAVAVAPYADIVAHAKALTDAMARRPYWFFEPKFGPSPAVDLLHYWCVGRGYATTYGLPTPEKQAEILNQVRVGQQDWESPFRLKCLNHEQMLKDWLAATTGRPQGVWFSLSATRPNQGASGPPIHRLLSWDALLPQVTTFAPPPDVTAEVRSRTVYQVISGTGLLDLVKLLTTDPNFSPMRSFIPTAFAQWANRIKKAANGTRFLNRDFVLAVSLRSQLDVTAFANGLVGMWAKHQAGPSAEKARLVSSLVDDVVVVVSPGIGFSLLPMLQNQIDPLALIAFMTSQPENFGSFRSVAEVVALVDQAARTQPVLRENLALISKQAVDILAMAVGPMNGLGDVSKTPARLMDKSFSDLIREPSSPLFLTSGYPIVRVDPMKLGLRDRGSLVQESDGPAPLTEQPSTELVKQPTDNTKLYLTVGAVVVGVGLLAWLTMGSSDSE